MEKGAAAVYRFGFRIVAAREKGSRGRIRRSSSRVAMGKKSNSRGKGRTNSSKEGAAAERRCSSRGFREEEGKQSKWRDGAAAWG